MPPKRPSSRLWRFLHKWSGLILALFLLLFAASGIVLNHRNAFSSIDVNRRFLPKNYHYHNWNLAAVKGTEIIGKDSVLLYGNIGIWMTQASFRTFTDFNQGFPQGVDNRKIFKVLKCGDGQVYAAALSGLYRLHPVHRYWNSVPLPEGDHDLMDLAWRNDTLFVLTRSGLIIFPPDSRPDFFNLPPPADYKPEVSLFKTLWHIHSGEILGLPGKLLVDVLGGVLIFLCLSGLVYFFFPGWIRRRKKKALESRGLIRWNRWSLRWHNKLGWMSFAFLLISVTTGMFLRPPLLIPIASVSIAPIPGSLLDTPNAWHDKLRRILYDDNSGTFLIATLDGVYRFYPSFSLSPERIPGQAPVSVMGVNVFEMPEADWLLLGSFEGLFLWQLSTGYVHDYILNEPFLQKSNPGMPLGRFLVSGYTRDLNGIEVFFDFDRGSAVLGTGERLPLMPPEIQAQPMSLWNLALEVHTTRIYQSLIGDLYILLIPLIGLGTLTVLISGFIVWYRHFRKKPFARKLRG